MAGRRRLLAVAARDEDVAAALEKQRKAASDVASLLARASSGAGKKEAVERAKNLLESAEREIAALLSAQDRPEQEAEVGYEEVKRQLPRDSALVAFVRYRHQNWRYAYVTSPTPSYAAFILRSGGQTVELHPLGAASEIDELVSRWRAQAGRGEGEFGVYRQAGLALRKKIWDPVTIHLGSVGTVFVVPDGTLHLVNLASLPATNAEFLVEGGPLLALLSEERDLLMATTVTEPGGRAVFFGDPDFDLAARDSTTVRAPFVLRGSPSSCDAYTDLRFCDLPATGAEARALGAVWRRARVSPQRPAVLTGGDASETAFRQQAPGARVIHLATHGFFLGGSCSAPAPAAPGSRGVGGLGPGPSEAQREEAVGGPAENPLLLSGVALSGANHLGERTPGHADGILSAEEIATLDLSGTEWAVLSACDSALGGLEAGEGVFGLRRAFRVAGARTLIMSLWAVEDQAARDWMEALYRARFEEGLSTAAAVRQASLAALDRRRQKGQSTHPFYWAGFVAAGDWR
jgi:CHAT domain-containing protein